MISKKEVAKKVIDSHAEAYLLHTENYYYDKKENLDLAIKYGVFILDAVIETIKQGKHTEFMGIGSTDINYWESIKEEVKNWK